MSREARADEQTKDPRTTITERTLGSRKIYLMHPSSYSDCIFIREPMIFSSALLPGAGLPLRSPKKKVESMWAQQLIRIQRNGTEFHLTF